MSANSPPLHETRIVPALHEIQRKFGYLNKEALQQFSAESGIPLYRLQGVASFFPHFQLEPPPLVTLKVCRDMACRMYGSGRILSALASMEDHRVRVEGVSCLGRCDRPPAACISIHRSAAPVAEATAGSLATARNPVPTEFDRPAQGDAVAPGGPHEALPSGARRDDGQPQQTGHAHTTVNPADHEHHEGHEHHDGQGHHNGHGAHGAHGHEQEFYYLGRIPDQLKKIVNDCLRDAIRETRPNRDGPLYSAEASAAQRAAESAGKPYARFWSAAEWEIDPYRDTAPDYTGVRRAVEARRKSLEKAAAEYRVKYNWSAIRSEQFIVACESRLTEDLPQDPTLLEAAREWQVKDDWADVLFTELDKAHANLRGMGGAGIPATQKWSDVREAVRTARRRREDDRAFIVVNGDESEPATFKDRELLLLTPHLIVEGVILAGLVTEATQGFIYIRHEYQEQIDACNRAIRRAEELGMCGLSASVLGRPFPVSVFPSPGGYICGEQSALIEAMSDRRGEPRNAPPKLETNGLDDRPTLVSNVETYAWVPYIWIKGGDAYGNLGVNGWKGRRFFSVSGDVIRPGVYEVPMGMTLGELIEGENYCRGISRKRQLKAFAPSGPSGGFLPAKLTARAGLPRKHTEKKEWQELAARRGFDPQAQELDIRHLELDLDLFRALSPTQSLGAGVVVYADDRDMVLEAVNALEFFRNESCGKCVPCRIGSQKMANLGTSLLQGKVTGAQFQNELMPVLKPLWDAMNLASICSLGRSVPQPLKTVAEYFPADLARHTSGGAAHAAPTVGLSAAVEPPPRGVAPHAAAPHAAPHAAAPHAAPAVRPAPAAPAPSPAVNPIRLEGQP